MHRNARLHNIRVSHDATEAEHTSDSRGLRPARDHSQPQRTHQDVLSTRWRSLSTAISRSVVRYLPYDGKCIGIDRYSGQRSATVLHSLLELQSFVPVREGAVCAQSDARWRHAAELMDTERTVSY